MSVIVSNCLNCLSYFRYVSYLSNLSYISYIIIAVLSKKKCRAFIKHRALLAVLCCGGCHIKIYYNQTSHWQT